MIDRDLARAYAFFKGTHGRAECALSLARAERWAQEEGLEFVWEHDREPYEMGDAETRMPNVVLNCCCQDADGAVLASLCSIGDPSPEYARVVQAELACEAMAQAQRADSYAL